jgi:sulfopyruvate decarboxylase TPP-binding subunit
MVKAKDFWSYLCEELDYRFFAGVACEGLKPLYNKMSSEFLHYVPAVDEKVALGLVNGARIAGVKGAVLMSADYLLDISNTLLSFNKQYEVPTLILCYDEEYYWAKDPAIVSLLLGYFKVMKIDDDVEIGNTFKDNLDIVIKGSEEENRPGIFFIGKGDLK